SFDCDFKLSDKLSPVLRREIKQLREDLVREQIAAAVCAETLPSAAEPSESTVSVTVDQANPVPMVGVDRGMGASQAAHPRTLVPAFSLPKEDRFRGFMEVGTLVEEDGKTHFTI
ncbi:unnamed protein product, partial [Polarella glacialis]